jgi:hypothetical protein
LEILIKSFGGMLLFLGGITWYRWEDWERWKDSFPAEYVVFWSAVIAVLPFVFLRMCEKKEDGIRLLTFAMAVMVAIALPADGCGFWGGVCIYALFASSVVSLAAIDGGRSVSRFTAFLSYAGIFVVLCILSYGDIWNDSFIRTGDFFGATSTVMLAVFLTISGSLLYFAFRKKNGLAVIWAATGLFLVVLKFLSMGSMWGTDCAFIVNGWALLIGVATIGIASIVVNIKLSRKFGKGRAQ